MKAQSTIIQFIIFFTLGLVIFASTGSFFKYQSDLLKAGITTSSLALVKDYMGAVAVEEYIQCKRCGSISVTTKLSNTTADYVFQIGFSQNSLFIATQPVWQTVTSGLSNLNYSLSLTPSLDVSIQGITLTYDKNKNTIVIQ